MKIYNEVLDEIKNHKKSQIPPFLKGYTRASSSGRCIKYRKYQILPEYNKEDANIIEMTDHSKLTTNFGDRFHDWLQEILAKRHGANFIYEKRLVNDRLKITGAFDGLLYIPDEDVFYLIDFKTTNPHKMKYLKKQNNADTNHIRQLLVYDHLLHQKDTYVLELINGEWRKFPLDNYPLITSYRNSKRFLRVCYIMRDAVNFAEYTYNPNDNEMRKLLERELRDIAEIFSLELGNQKETTNEWECKYCPYINYCKGVVNE